MGVRDVEATKKAKELLGIPEDEPVFILRAQDILYPATIAAYEQLYCSAVIARKGPVDDNGELQGMTSDEWAFADHLDAARENGRRWQKRNSGKVKVPD